jgi:uncharacterized protein (DUF305 family)
MDAKAEELPELSFDQLMELDRRAAERAGDTGQGDGDAGDGDGGDDEPGGDGDDVVVLPWWQHPMNIVTLVVTAALIAGMLGWMVGANSRPSHNEVDTGFLHDMRVHHEQAVYMSFVYRTLPDRNPGLDMVAGSIIMGQSQEVGRMVQLLRGFGEAEAAPSDALVMGWMGMATEPDQMLGLASEADIETLQASSGEEADRLFVELMVAHHEGGIHMAEYAVEHAENDEVRKMAAAVVAGQQSEIDELRDQLD